MWSWTWTSAGSWRSERGSNPKIWALLHTIEIFFGVVYGMSQHHEEAPHWVVGIIERLDRIHLQGKHLMSKVTDFAAAVQTAFDHVSTDLDTIKAGIANLDALIVAFQNSPGTLSVEDQAALDKIQAASAALVAKVDTIDVTPPTPPAA